VEEILRYIGNIQPDSSGESWVLVSRIMVDLSLTREEVYTELMKVKERDLVRIIKTLEPGPYGLLSVTITDRSARE